MYNERRSLRVRIKKIAATVKPLLQIVTGATRIIKALWVMIQFFRDLH